MLVTNAELSSNFRTQVPSSREGADLVCFGAQSGSHLMDRQTLAGRQRLTHRCFAPSSSAAASPFPERVLAVLAHQEVDRLAHQGLKSSSVLGRQHV